MNAEKQLKIEAEDAGGAAAQALMEELCSSLNHIYGTMASPFSPNDVKVARAVFVVHAKVRRSLRNRPLMKLPRRPTKRACNSVRFVLKDQAAVASQRFGPSQMQEFE